MQDLLAGIGRFGLWMGRVGLRAATPPWRPAMVLQHTWDVLLRCLLPVCAVTFPFGFVIALQGLDIFDLYGAQRMLPSLLSVAVLRELSPVLASVLVAAQGGSAFAAELGAMRIKEEIDATEAMAVDSVRWHVAPRVLALILSCPILHVFGAVAGIAGGWVLAVLLRHEPSGVFMQQLWALTHPFDLWSGILKTLLYGGIIGLIACWHGYFARGGAAGVGKAVNDTVVHCTIAFFLANYLLSSAMFGSGA
jgi:phospholipid/cholesterol/gamma-HCH transport system permease protein